MPTEAEQNRLIIENSGLVQEIAAEFRGRKGIPFEELEAEGMAALVQAARRWEPVAYFPIYAHKFIRGRLLDFIQAWQVFERLDEEYADLDRVYEWQTWGVLPSEGWTRLEATPEVIREAFEDLAGKQEAVAAAMLSLTPLDRKLIEKHFLRSPPMKIAQIARDHRMSYYRAVSRLWRAVRKMRTAARGFMANRIPA